MNKVRDDNEPFLTDIQVSAKGYSEKGDSESCLIRVPAHSKVTLSVKGKAPNGKPLLKATFRWPYELDLLPTFTYQTTENNWIGLVDGFCSAPIKPENLSWDLYNYFYSNPKAWHEVYDKAFEGGDEAPNWLFYGYHVPIARHKAFDIWAEPGTPVHAVLPGTIVKGDWDHIIAIKYPAGKVDYNHIIPIVNYGDKVYAGQIIGHIDHLRHVHLEFRPNGEVILSCFPGLTKETLVYAPEQGPVPVLPFFGE